MRTGTSEGGKSESEKFDAVMRKILTVSKRVEMAREGMEA